MQFVTVAVIVSVFSPCAGVTLGLDREMATRGPLGGTGWLASHRVMVSARSM